MRYSIFFLALLIFSCNQKKNKDDNEVKKPLLRVAVKHKVATNLDKKFLDQIDSWNEFRTLESFIKKFYEISPSEALSNARELSMIAQSVKDSIRPDFLKNRAFKARANVFLNEALRLEDMSNISSIGAEAVNEQVQKIVDTHLSLELHIATVLKKKKLDDEVFDTDYNSSIDSARIFQDSLNRKLIFNKNIENAIKKQEQKVLKKKNKS